MSAARRLVLLAGLFAGALTAPASGLPAPEPSVVVMLDSAPRRALVHARGVGLNLEMSLISDRMWRADGHWIERTFHDLGLKTLRWGYSAIWWDAFAEKPLTDNYWSAANTPDAAGSFGLKEFVAYCKRTGTTPSIMLPVDALAAGVSMERVVDLSRRIAEYVRDQKLATPVYLEMGNEPYTKPKLAPERYAEALRLLYPMVKAIDPRFLVVAQVDRAFQPFVTEPCADFYDVIQWHHYLTCGGKGADPWAWYYGQDNVDLAGLNEGDVVKVPPGKGYVIGEINVLWPDWFAPMAGDLRSSLAYLDLLLCTINTDRADAILPWPSLWPAHKGGAAYGLFDYDAFAHGGKTRVFPAVLGAHRILKDAVLDEVVPVRITDPKIRAFAYASADRAVLTVTLINKRPEARIVRIPLPARPAAAEAWGLAAGSGSPAYTRLPEPRFDADAVTVSLAAESAVLLRLRLSSPIP
jgi:hypothetical protein